MRTQPHREDVRHQLRRIFGSDWSWVVPQLVGLTVIIVVVPTKGRRGLRLPAIAGWASVPLLFASAWIAHCARSDLSRSFTMSPTPVSDGILVERGVYGSIRHPMYLSVLLFVAGYALAWRSRLGGLCFAACTTFVAAKTRHEERALHRHYPRYAEYCERVRWRFLPGII